MVSTIDVIDDDEDIVPIEETLRVETLAVKKYDGWSKYFMA